MRARLCGVFARGSDERRTWCSLEQVPVRSSPAAPDGDPDFSDGQRTA